METDMEDCKMRPTHQDRMIPGVIIIHSPAPTVGPVLLLWHILTVLCSFGI